MKGSLGAGNCGGAETVYGVEGNKGLGVNILNRDPLGTGTRGGSGGGTGWSANKGEEVDSGRAAHKRAGRDRRAA